VWFDNFSKIYFRTTWSLSGGVQVNSLNSASGWIPSKITLHLSKDLLAGFENTLAAFLGPDQIQKLVRLCKQQLPTAFWKRRSQLAVTTKTSSYKYPTSTRQGRKKILGGAGKFFPIQFHPYNVGSNIGFVHLINHFTTTLDVDRTHIFLVDLDLYWKWNRLIYARQKFYPELRNRFIFCLGLWHPLKQITKLVWNHFSSSVLAPAFLHLFPTQKFRLKADLQTKLVFLNDLARAYQSIGSTVRRAERLLKQPVPGFSTFLQFFEYFLPLVSNQTTIGY